MPIKHQTESYRTRKNGRLVCDQDAETREDAKARVAELRAEGFAAFYETHDGGAYYRVFVDEKKYPKPPTPNTPALRGAACNNLTAPRGDGRK